MTLEDLSEPYSRHLCEHLIISPRQATSRSSQFLEACKAFNQGEITKEQLLDVTVQKGFNNVIDAFHNVNSDEIPIRFYQKDYGTHGKRIILTDEIYRLHEVAYYSDFMNETESRWNLVETSWELGVSRNLLNVQYDDSSRKLFVDERFRRKSVTSARDALNGYQKGKCFYCFDDITVNGDELLRCDVDHFFPRSLQRGIPHINLDGVWNLVLACPACNRGAAGKMARIPALKYLSRLHKRNEFLISSHHPLRETLMNQTGNTEDERTQFLQEMDKQAINVLIHRWETKPVGIAVF